MRYIELTIVEFGAGRPFKLELSARDPGLRVTLVRVTAYDQFGLYRWRTAHSEVTFAQVLITSILCCSLRGHSEVAHSSLRGHFCPSPRHHHHPLLL